MAERTIPDPEDYMLHGRGEPPHQSSLTALAAEALRSGVLPDDEDGAALRTEGGLLPEEARRPTGLTAGDADGDELRDALDGDETPSGDNPLPDQNNVDEIGRASGLSDEDNGELRSAEELLGRRDQRRWELDPRSRDPDEA